LIYICSSFWNRIIDMPVASIWTSLTCVLWKYLVKRGSYMHQTDVRAYVLLYICINVCILSLTTVHLPFLANIHDFKGYNLPVGDLYFILVIHCMIHNTCKNWFCKQLHPEMSLNINLCHHSNRHVTDHVQQQWSVLVEGMRSPYSVSLKLLVSSSLLL
jgi:hypothetical protein